MTEANSNDRDMYSMYYNVQFASGSRQEVFQIWSQAAP